MRIVFLGTGGYHPNERRHTAGIFLPDLGLLLDAGTGTFRLGRFLKHPELTILLSHAHLDHVVGLTYLLPFLNAGTLRRIRLLGTAATLRAVDEHLFSERLFPVRVPAETAVVGNEPLQWHPPGATGRPLTVTAFPLPCHRGGSTGYRLDGPSGSFAYVTDTGPDDSYVERIRGVDVLIHECNFPDDQHEWAERTGHCYLSHVLRIAERAAAGRLWLTHLDPTLTGPDPLGLDTSSTAARLRRSGMTIAVAEDLTEFTLTASSS
ncbi:MAG: MBL fold metallo-hydrolase [Planctomycetota bacterium]|nr:MAG: MBL fold metallo-hydrolase [Planctomycetota bacterium]